VEHLTEEQVKKFIIESERILKPHGYLFIITPNFSSILRYIHGKNWYGYSDPTHINFYTPQELSNLLKKHKFNNITTNFKNKGNPSLWDYPLILNTIPRPFKNILIRILFSSSLSFARNSFWMAGEKK
jgi:predicted SAM-dependent methyltransferase